MINYMMTSERGSVRVTAEDGEEIAVFELHKEGTTIEVYDQADVDMPPVWIVETVFDALEKIMDVDPEQFKWAM